MTGNPDWQQFCPALLHYYSHKHKVVILCLVIHELIYNFIKKEAKMGLNKSAIAFQSGF